MSPVLVKGKYSKILKRFASLKITVACLGLLFVLTFWGTVAQVQNGLYSSQERYFFSLFFLAAGILPFPGAKLVLGILFVNLCATALTRFTWERSKLGISVIHLGLLSYFISALVVYTGTVESNVTLMEGDGTNISSAYHEWELSAWQKPADEKIRQVYALDIKKMGIGQPNIIVELPLKIAVDNYYTNAQAYSGQANSQFVTVNDSGIAAIKEAAVNKEPEKNIPGGIFMVTLPNAQVVHVLLYGAENSPTQLRAGNAVYNLQLRRKKYPLPFILALKDFKMVVYPNTQLAKSYQSLVEIKNNDLAREVLISMNKPLRYKNFTVYQASYSIDQMGRELSTLAVVKNPGWTLPYISSGITFVGLLIHFLMMAFTQRNKNRTA